MAAELRPRLVRFLRWLLQRLEPAVVLTPTCADCRGVFPSHDIFCPSLAVPDTPWKPRPGGYGGFGLGVGDQADMILSALRNPVELEAVFVAHARERERAPRALPCDCDCCYAFRRPLV